MRGGHEISYVSWSLGGVRTWGGGPLLLYIMSKLIQLGLWYHIMCAVEIICTYMYTYTYTMCNTIKNVVSVVIDSDSLLYKTKYMVTSRDQNAGRIHSVSFDITFERVEEFKYWGTTSTNENSIAEEIKSRFKSGNACYHSVQNLLSSRLLSKNLETKIYRTIILPVVLYGCETW